MKISNNNIAHAIFLALKTKTDKKEIEAFFSKVKNFLANKHLMQESENILTSLEKRICLEEKILIVNVSSAIKLTENIKQDLIKFIKKKYSCVKLILIESLDKKLIDGIRIEINDEVIDLSLKNKINELQQYLNSKA